MEEDRLVKVSELQIQKRNIKTKLTELQSHSGDWVWKDDSKRDQIQSTDKARLEDNWAKYTSDASDGGKLGKAAWSIDISDDPLKWVSGHEREIENLQKELQKVEAKLNCEGGPEHPVPSRPLELPKSQSGISSSWFEWMKPPDLGWGWYVVIGAGALALGFYLATGKNSKTTSPTPAATSKSTRSAQPGGKVFSNDGKHSVSIAKFNSLSPFGQNCFKTTGGCVDALSMISVMDEKEGKKLTMMTVRDIQKCLQSGSGPFYIQQYDNLGKLVFQQITDVVMMPGEVRMVKLQTTSGAAISLTPDHEVLTPSDFCKSGELIPGDEIRMTGGMKQVIASVETVVCAPCNVITKHRNYALASGFVVPSRAGELEGLNIG